MVGRGGEGVLVGSPIHRFAHKLFGCRVGHGADGHAGRGDATGVIDGRAIPKSATNTLGSSVSRSPTMMLAGYVPMQQTSLVGIVQCAGNGRRDSHNMADWQACWVAQVEQVTEVGPLDVVHRDPQLTVLLTPVVDAHDVRMAEACGRSASRMNLARNEASLENSGRRTFNASCRGSRGCWTR